MIKKGWIASRDTLKRHSYRGNPSITLVSHTFDAKNFPLSNIYFPKKHLFTISEGQISILPLFKKVNKSTFTLNGLNKRCKNKFKKRIRMLSILRIKHLTCIFDSSLIILNPTWEPKSTKILYLWTLINCKVVLSPSIFPSKTQGKIPLSWFHCQKE